MWIGWAKERDKGGSKRRRQVHGTGIYRHQEIDPLQERDQNLEVRSTGRHERGRVHAARQTPGYRKVRGRSDHKDPGPMSMGQRLPYTRELLLSPEFCRPTRLWIEGDH